VQSEGEADLALQFIAETELAVNRAVAEVWKSIEDHCLPLRIVTFHGGFNCDDQRSWLGFQDGISNIERSERRKVIEVLDQGPQWMQGGTYMAFLRLAIDLAAWRSLSRAYQEILVGRDKMSGCPLEAVAQRAMPVPLQGYPLGSNLPRSPQYIDPPPPHMSQHLLMASHIHRANLNRNLPAGDSRSHRIFRQGYEFLDPGAAGQLRFGLNFVSFQCSLGHLKHILTSDVWLGKVNFGGHTNPDEGGPPPLSFLSVLAGGFYAIPPKGDPFPGADIF
jgi:deferrochelatase/peroxidase EfeB